MTKRKELTDSQLATLEPFIPPPTRRPDGGDHPIKLNERLVLNGALWVPRTGAAWADLPNRLPSGTTCFRRFSR